MGLFGMGSSRALKTRKGLIRSSYDRAQPGGHPGGFTSFSPPTPYTFKADLPLQGVPGVGVGNMGFRGAPNGAAPRGLLESLAGAGGILVKRDIAPTAAATGTYLVPPNNVQTVPLGGLTGAVYQTGQLTAQALMSYQQGQAYNGQGPAPSASTF